MLVETVHARVQLDGVLIAYRDFGPRAGHELADVPVLLVHGMGGDGHTWDRFARTLTRTGRRVIVPDLRGHGRSAHTGAYPFDAFGADLLRLCEELDLRSVDLVGHSLGGYAASCAAIRRPGLVRRLVLEEQPLPLRAHDAPAPLTRRMPTVPELWHASTSLLRHPGAVLAFDRSMTRSALEQFRTPNPVWWDGLSSITAPTLKLRGGPGGMVDPQRLEHFRTAVADCTVVAFDCGHSIHRDRFHQFTAATLPFLSDRRL